MNDNDFSQHADDYHRIAAAIRFVEANFRSRPTLDDIAASVHLSKFHFQRMFKRWAGISAVQFMQYLTLDYAKDRLARSRSLLTTSLDAGFSGPARLHDLFVTFDAMTPGEFKKGGDGLTIEYGLHSTPFGECLLALTARGICHLSFVGENGPQTSLKHLYQSWPQATVVENQAATKDVIDRIFTIETPSQSRPFHLLIKGTNFQINVWRALLSLPRGSVFSYRDIAAHIGRPKAFRAVANAIAINPVGYLIPCHRVIANSGKVHKYRWGTTRKKAILGWEFARQATEAVQG